MQEPKQETTQEASQDPFQGLGTHKPKPLLEDLLPQPLVEPSQPESTQPQSKIAIIIDTNVLIKQIPLRDLYPLPAGVDFASRYTVHTLRDVFKELKDDSARQFLEHLPYELQVHDNVESKYFEFVRNFSKETGDYKSLSYVDLRVMALGLQICDQKGEYSRVQRKPKELTEFKPKRFEDDYKKLEDATAGSDSEEEEESDDEGDKKQDDSDEEDEQQKPSRRGKNPSEGFGFDDFQPVAPKKHGDRKNHIVPKQQKVEETPSQVEVPSQVVEIVEKVVASDPVEKVAEPLAQVVEQQVESDSDSIDDEVQGGEWVTPDNLYKHIGAAVSKPLELEKPEKDDGNPRLVHYVTSDYAMQNVIIQMGFKLLSLDGRRITRVKRFKLLCRACQKLNLNIERMFCQYCGSSTLIKVSVFINQNGEMTYFKNPRRKPKLRGTKYSLPKPQGGRMGDGLILREDELLKGEKKMMVHRIEKEKRIQEKTLNDTIEGNYWAGGAGYGANVSNLLYENGAKGGRTHSKMSGMTGDSIVIGKGRQNPNVVKKRTGNKK